MNILLLISFAIFHKIVPTHLQLLRAHSAKLSEVGRLTFPEIALKYGFPAQQEIIITKDGYILTINHIFGNPARSVLLIHGNTASSECWIERGHGSLAITLAKQGYDVWAVNLRGTRFSRKHVFLNPDTQPDLFFDYSFYEEAIYDVPAAIDFILEKTGQKQLTVVGHSVGTTLLYVMGAEKPEYNDKIKVAISLAPISFIQNMRGFVRIAIALAPELIALSHKLNIQEVFDYKKTAPLLQALCLKPLGYEMCIKIGLFSIFGRDPAGFEPGFQKTLYGHFPAGSSRKIFQHLSQVARRNNFTKFDYGPVKNLLEYGRPEPPEFDLKKVTMKSALFVGKEDYLGTVADAERLKASLPNVVHYQVLPYEHFNHADFIWGRYMEENFFPYLLEVINRYT